MIKRINAGVLRVAYYEDGPPDGMPVFLLHGFPYDTHSFDRVIPILESHGCRCITPYLRGFGPTEFLFSNTFRSGQQAALAHDLLAFMDAMNVQNAILAGFDWGGRAACIVAALWPERVRALVSAGGYIIQDIPKAISPQSPNKEYRHWYQYYFHSERGQVGLLQYRHELCKLLWQLWSPNWEFDEETFNQTVTSFNNPDFVDVVIHSYRHRFGIVLGDPSVENTERCLTEQPNISVPTIALYGENDGVNPGVNLASHKYFNARKFDYVIIPGVGHNPPQEDLQSFAEAILSLK